MDDDIWIDKNKREHRALEAIRTESLDPYNRLHSIAEDAFFVKNVQKHYSDLPCLANLRCGAWYTDPADAHICPPAYFKSTDGHYNGWSFNLRRPNIHILPIIHLHHGVMLVDSTRAGKRIPDALSKTVSIWCCVVNRALQSRFNIDPANWDNTLYTPPTSVSPQEHSRIESFLDGWAKDLLASSYELPRLQRPIRPIWITPATTAFPAVSTAAFYPIICISASKLTPEGLERRSAGFAYVQGSGDDHESWSCGLTPELFWQNREVLLNTSREELADVMATLVSRRQENNKQDLMQWMIQPSPIEKVRGRIYIAALDDVPRPLPFCIKTHESLAYIIITPHSQADLIPNDSPENGASEPNPNPNHQPPPDEPPALTMFILPGKKGEYQLIRDMLPRSISFIHQQLESGLNICIACESGKDLSVGIAVAALQMFFDEQGEYVGSGNDLTKRMTRVDKSSLRTRLQWIISSRPEANPSRVTLKRVNEYFMTSGSAPSQAPS